MVPAVAVKLVAPDEVNCFVVPRVTEADVGEMTCGVADLSVTLALAEPPGPVAVTVTALDEGMVDGAVYSPEAEMVPAVAVQDVAPVEVNCFDCPRVMDSDVGDMVCGLTKVTVNTGPQRLPGLLTCTVPVPGLD
jgi:hypothetical protein